MFIKTNAQLQELAREALDNYHFDDDTDPDGKVKEGLKIILSGNVDDDEVKDIFFKSNYQMGTDKWDVLDIYAKALAES